MLRRWTAWRRRLAWVSLLGVLAFAMGPFGLTSAAAALAPCPCAELQIDACGAPEASHCSPDESCGHGAIDRPESPCRQGCPDLPYPGHNCCRAGGAGVAAILPLLPEIPIHDDQVELPALRAGAGRLVTRTFLRPPQA
ncbi:MAG TPA: hypothetical protein VEI97_09420 [bacterium]|nr:hypothetical protein [bacterium]